MKRYLFDLCLFLIVLMALWYILSDNEPPLEPFTPIDGESVTITGRVFEHEDQSFTLEDVNILVDTANQQIFQTKYKVICKLETTKLKIGDCVTLKGRFRLFSDATNPGEFDFRKFYYTKGVCGQIDKASFLYNWSEKGLSYGSDGMLYGGNSKSDEGKGTSNDVDGNLDNGDGMSYAGNRQLVNCNLYDDKYRNTVAMRLWFGVRENLNNLRVFIHNRIYEVFPENEAGVINAMLLGDKSELDRDLKDLYQRNGIIHILSISGLHISLIGMGIYKLLRKVGLPIWLSAMFGGTLLGLYGVMTGMSISACRAIGMFGIRMLGLCIGRTYDMLTALGIMAALTLWNNPSMFEYAGFYLSYLAVVAIGVVFPLISSGIEKKTQWKYVDNKMKLKLIEQYNTLIYTIKLNFLSALSISWVTVPIQLWFYYEIPVYSVFLNMLILPLMGIVTFTGVLSTFLPFGNILSGSTCFILMIYEKACLVFERLPLHTWNPGRPQVWQMIVYYAIMLIWLVATSVMKKDKGLIKGKLGICASAKNWFRRYILLHRLFRMNSLLDIDNGKTEPKYLIYISTLLAISISVFVLTIRINNNEIVFLDVGQGDCIYVETKEGQHFMFDCGSSSRSKISTNVVIPFLKYKGVNTLDGLFLSHPDEDHTNGAIELIGLACENELVIRNVILGANCDDLSPYELEGYLNLVGYANDKSLKINDSYNKTDINIICIGAGDRIVSESGEISFLCLHPTKGFEAKDTNEDSECFLLECGDLKALFTGDIQGAGEDELILKLKKYGIENIDILKVAHHGSRNSTGEDFLDIIRPKTAIISCGENNSYGHPHKETLERLEAAGAAIYRTDELGAIIFTISRSGEVTIEGYRHVVGLGR